MLSVNRTTSAPISVLRYDVDYFESKSVSQLWWTYLSVGDLFWQVSTRSGISTADIPLHKCATGEDTLAYILGAPSIDDVMSYNSLTTLVFTYFYPAQKRL